jgi:ketosteroid isomerase-like protein
MKRASAVLLAVVVAWTSAAWTSAAWAEEKGDKTSEDLKALDLKLTEAHKNHDVKTLEKYTSEDFILVDALGRVWDRKKNLGAIEKKTLKFDELKESDIKVRVFGDTAVVTGLLDLKGKSGDNDISGQYRWTRVYNKKGGEWQCVAEQHTWVAQKLPGKEKEQGK